MIGIVGASGFIGSSISELLSSRGIAHAAYIRSLKRFPHGAWSEHCNAHELTIGDPFYSKIFDGVTTLILSASASKPGLENNTVHRELNANVIPHSQFLLDLHETDVKKIVYLSSGGTIYGNVQSSSPISEATPRRPCTAYGYGKLCIEAALENTWTTSGRSYCIVRPSNPVGYRQFSTIGAHGLVTTAFSKILNQKTVTVYGDGSTVRDYFDVEDLADLLFEIAQRPVLMNDILNASSGHGTSINEVIETCSEVLGIAPKIENVLEKAPKIPFSVLENTLAYEVYGWQPKKSFRDIVEGLYESLRA